MIGFKSILILGSVLSLLGLLGLLMRKNLVIMLMSLELMMLGAALALLGAARYHSVASGVAAGGMAIPFVLAIAAAEVCVGLSLVIKLFKTNKTVWVDDLDKTHS